MSITYYSITEKNFAAASGEIHGRESLIDLTPAHLDHADHVKPSARSDLTTSLYVQLRVKN